MRVSMKLTLVAAALLSLSACQKEEKAPAAATTPAASAAAPQFASESAKQSYALGVSAGKYLNNAVAEHKKLNLELLPAEIIRGVQDATSEKSLLSDEEVQKILTALDEQFRNKQAEAAKVKAEEAKSKGVAYLAENGKKPGVTTTASGLQYEVLTKGDGAKPKAEDIVRVKYKGTFIDGAEFDSTEKNGGQPAEFALNQVIKGWTEGVQLMGVGSKFKFTVPSELGYGERDVGPIPGNSVLVFEVELLGIGASEAAPAATAESTK